MKIEDFPKLESPLERKNPETGKRAKLRGDMFEEWQGARHKEAFP